MVTPEHPIVLADSGEKLIQNNPRFSPMLTALANYDGPLTDFRDDIINLKLPTHRALDVSRQDSEVVKTAGPDEYVLKRYTQSEAANLQFITMNALSKELAARTYTSGNYQARVSAVRHHALVHSPRGVVAVIELAAGQALHEIVARVLYDQKRVYRNYQQEWYLQYIPRLVRMAVNDALGEKAASKLVDDIAEPYESPGRIMMQNVFVDERPASVLPLLTVIDQPRLKNLFDTLKSRRGVRKLGDD
jgi:hypothetical protein